MESETLSLDKTRTGGPRGPKLKVRYLLDDAAVEECSGVFCAVGDLIEGKMRRKVFAFWLGSDLSSADRGCLSIEQASHLLHVEGISEQIIGCDIIRGFGRPGEDDEEGEGNRLRFVLMACTASGTLFRWSVHLDEVEVDVEKEKEKKKRHWSTIPSAYVDDKVFVEGTGIDTTTTASKGSLFSLGDCNPKNNLQDHDHSPPSDAWVLSAGQEDGMTVLRDGQLSVIHRFDPHDYPAYVHRLASVQVPSISLFGRDEYSGASLLLLAHKSGALAAWDLEPCIRVDEQALALDIDILDQLVPKLSFFVNLEKELSHVLSLPTSHPQEGRSHWVVAFRDGRVKVVDVCLGVDEYNVGTQSGVNIRNNGNNGNNGMNEGDAEYSAGGVSNTDAGAAVIVERYLCDLNRETRSSLNLGLTRANQADVGGSGSASTSVKSHVSAAPRALALVLNVVNKGPTSAVAASALGTGTGCELLCVVTAGAVLYLSVPQLKVQSSAAFDQLAIALGGNGVGSALAQVHACSTGVLLLPALDRSLHFVLPENVRACGAEVEKETNRHNNQIAVKKPLRSKAKPTVVMTVAKADQGKRGHRDRDSEGFSGITNSNSPSAVGEPDGVNAVNHQILPLSLFMSAADYQHVKGESADEDEDDNDGEFSEQWAGRGNVNGNGNVKPSPLSLALAGGSAGSKKPTNTNTPSKATNKGSSNNNNIISRGAGGAGGGGPSPVPGKKANTIAVGALGSGRRVGVVVVDQPVTFHSRIKSSGYGQAPNTALGALAKRRQDRLTQAQKNRTNSVKDSVLSGNSNSNSNGNSNGNTNVMSRSSTAPSAISGSGRLRRYPVTCPLISVHQAHNEFTASSSAGAVNRLSFSEDGCLLGIASPDCAVATLRLPISRHGGEGSFYMSHDSSIGNVCFSHQREPEKQVVLSCSVDGTARLWKTGKVDNSAVAFTHDRHSVGTSLNAANTNNMNNAVSAKGGSSQISKGKGNGNGNGDGTTRNRPFGGPVLDASFYYHDKFVALAHGNKTSLYSYSFDHADIKNDLKRLQSTGTYKRVHAWHFSESKSVTALACVNSVLSPLLFVATSDRRVSVLDAVRGTVCRTLQAPHDKAVHHIALPQPSVYAQLEQPAYNVFATASMDNSIQIWDLRAPAVQCRYTGHVNRREPVRCAISPCLRYLACGSEDKAARLVDLRVGTELLRYTGHKDVVSDVAFHPIIPQLATASYDGTVRFYHAAGE